MSNWLEQFEAAKADGSLRCYPASDMGPAFYSWGDSKAFTILSAAADVFITPSPALTARIQEVKRLEPPAEGAEGAEGAQD